MKNSGFFLLALLFLFSACHPWDHPADDDTQLTRTVLVYMVAENSLSYGNFHEQDLNELLTASGEIPSKCHLLVYVDDTDTPRLYLVENGSTSSKPRLLKQWTEDMNSCATETLRQMMEIMTTLLPSKSYGLVFWSHGNAWLPGSRTAANNRKAPASLSAPRSEPQRTIGIDNGGNSFSNTGSKMEISELAEVLSDFPKLSFLMFDACFMQTIEVAYELRHVTDYVIASPAEIPNPGAPYDRILPCMFSATTDVEGIIDEYYHHYADSAITISNRSTATHGAVLSVVKTSELDALQRVTAQMIQRYATADEDKNLAEVLRYFPLSMQSIPEFYDMKAYMRHLITSDDDWAVWLEAFDHAVPYRRATEHWYTSYTGRYMYIGSRDTYGGVSMFVPQPGDFYSMLFSQFRQTSWYPVSGWPTVFP